jgi:hypothetical protein
VIALVWWEIGRQMRAPAEVRAALEQSGYRVLSLERRYFRLGPYFFRHSRAHVVFLARVADPATGQPRDLWVRWGRWWPLQADSVDLEWDR